MTAKEAKKLRPGDEVFWNDPDDGACSTYLSIQTIEVFGTDLIELGDPVVVICEPSGGCVECYASELA